MKTAPGFDQVVGASHAVNTRVLLRRHDDTPVGELPIEDGTITGSAGFGLERWRGTITLAGLDWAPMKASDPLSCLSGHYCSVQRAALPYGAAETWVEVARLWPVDTTVVLSRSDATMSVDLASAAALVDQAGALDYTHQQNETCQEMAVRVINEHLPYTPTVLDTSAPVPAPSDFAPTDTTPERVVTDLDAIANTRTYFDALGRLVIRPALPSLDVGTFVPVRDVAVDLDITRYQLTIGRSLFANTVTARFTGASHGNTQAKPVDGIADIGSGPLRVDGPAGRLHLGVTLDIHATQAEAEAYAESVLTAVKQGWCTAEIEAVQDPRLEPDDVFTARYLDRTLRHRVVTVQFDLRTDAMRLTARTSLQEAT